MLRLAAIRTRSGDRSLAAGTDSCEFHLQGFASHGRGSISTTPIDWVQPLTLQALTPFPSRADLNGAAEYPPAQGRSPSRRAAVLHRHLGFGVVSFRGCRRNPQANPSGAGAKRYESQSFRGNRLFFPGRNATMSALTEATVIVEAGETSGTRIHANAALEQGRKLFILESRAR